MSTPRHQPIFWTTEYRNSSALRTQAAWEAIAAAQDDPGAETVLTEGRWAGFTTANATAWCWNLVQYEPRGFISPNSQVRMMFERDLAQGLVPEWFNYADLARSYEQDGISARAYRLAKERAGARTFTPVDVVMTGHPHRQSDPTQAVPRRANCVGCCAHPADD